jgi:hypothetical protein
MLFSFLQFNKNLPSIHVIADAPDHKRHYHDRHHVDHQISSPVEKTVRERAGHPGKQISSAEAGKNVNKNRIHAHDSKERGDLPEAEYIHEEIGQPHRQETPTTAENDERTGADTLYHGYI